VNLENIRRVIIGGTSNLPAWKTLNADPATRPDILADVRSLDGLEPSSVSVFYLSHVLEHVELGAIFETLARLRTALKPGGTLFISVPNLTTLAELLGDQDLDLNQKVHVLRMIFGGQITKYDYHYFGYTFEVLAAFLKATGYTGIRKVADFKLHDDTSAFRPYKGIPISLNVVCHKS
jgi:predicted SAM-dependent methyltransferase